MNVTSGRVVAQLGDLYPRWLGTRELLLSSRNPYGLDVSREIQTAYYGHPVLQDYGDANPKIIDEQRFAYPVYVVFLLAPTVYLSFWHVELVASIILTILCVASVLLWLDFLHWRLPGISALAVILFVLSSPQVTQGLRLLQLGLAEGFLLAFSAWCTAKNHLATAGITLAVATIKPQMILLPLIWFLFWALSDFPRRWGLVAGFVAAMAGLIGAGEVLLPGWITFFLDGLHAYPKYFLVTSTLEAALGYRSGDILAVILFLYVLVVAWQHRTFAADSREFALALAAFAIVAIIALPFLFTPYNQVLLILPMLIILRDWGCLPKFIRWAFVVCLSWPCITSLILLCSSHQWNTSSRLPLLPLSLSPYLPLLLLVLLLSLQTHRTNLSY